MTPKERFLQNKDLSDKWHMVASSEWFQDVVVYARAQMIDSKITTEELDGARRFYNILMDLAEHEPNAMPAISAGLNRNLDVPRKTLQTVNPEKK